ncbi:UNVERIFIED_CONTAM: hypothetical protein RMT77_009602 [Armadillidium vulgare]|nr:N-acetylserotonin O-methyltransferase-like protein [Armadillidium vulgare]
MIIQFLNELNKKNIILASSSPRRKEIIEKLGIAIQVLPSTFEENLDPKDFSSPGNYVIETAKGKTREIAGRVSAEQKPVDLIIGADTCVALGGNIFGKPKDEKDAFQMLKKLGGKSHEVITGVHLMAKKSDNTWQESEFSEVTTVKFASLKDELIQSYVNTKEPMDKAGGYGIQGIGGSLIEGIDGDYYNVMGFPLHRFTLYLLSIFEMWKM